MSEPIDKELERWLAEEVMGFYALNCQWHSDNPMRIYEIMPIVTEFPIWQPLDDLNQMMECVEKFINGSWWEFNHYYQGVGDCKVHLIELKSSDPYRANPVLSKHESLHHAIGYALWEALKGDECE